MVSLSDITSRCDVDGAGWVVSEELHCGVSAIDQTDEREQAGVVNGYFFKRNCSAGCVEHVCSVEGDDKGVGRLVREGCVDRVYDVVCASGDAESRLSHVGQVSAYFRLLPEAYSCAKT